LTIFFDYDEVDGKFINVVVALIKSDGLEMLEWFYIQNTARVVVFYGYWWWAYP